MLIDFRLGIRIFPQTCPRGLVFRLQQYKINHGDEDYGHEARIWRLLQGYPVALEGQDVVIDSRGDDAEVVEIKLGPSLGRLLPKIGAAEPELRVYSYSSVNPVLREEHDVRVKIDPVSGGLLLRFAAFTVVVQDFSATVNVKTPIETGTFSLDTSPPQTAWERMVSDD